MARARALDALCKQHGIALKAAAIQFCLAHPAVTIGLQGARTAQEAADNIAMAHAPIPAAFWHALRASQLIDAHAPLPGEAR